MTLKNHCARVLTTLALIVLLMVPGALSGLAAFTPTLTVEDRAGAVGDFLSVPIVLSEAPTGISGFELLGML